jgi:hypothetical protein
MEENPRTTTGQPAAPLLPSNRAFVVQFAAETLDESGVRGRVEHVASGEATRFDSWTRLQGFIEGRLRDAGRPEDDVRGHIPPRRDRA